ALVAAVTDDTPAAHAGLKPCDIITSVGSESVKTPKDLSRLVAYLSPGAKKSLIVWRDGKTIDLIAQARQARSSSAEQGIDSTD
ncbi:PDZ domain-containing protein, partial [Rhizobium ruizarguesonis]